jgi:hypothetical protein
MAAGAWQVYANGLVNILGGNIDLADATHLRMTLVTSSYTPSRDAHSTWADVSANEVANGNGYTTHGKVLAGTVTASGSPSDLITFDVDDQSWTSSTITAKYAVIVEDADADNALASTDLLIAYCDLDTGGGSVSTTNGTFAVTINASGVFTVNQTN